MTMRLMKALAVALLVGLLVPAAAAAHADLERSIPEAGAEIDAVPAQIELWFSEELAEGSTAEIVGPDGERVDNEDAAIDLFDPDRKHMTVTLKPGLMAGTYTVNWTTVSGEDDDTHSGSFAFTLTSDATPVASPIASPEASPEASPSSEETTTRILAQAPDSSEVSKPDGWAFLIALGVGLVAAVGIYLFWLLVKPRK